jgi:shikimate dehydrogenase
MRIGHRTAVAGVVGWPVEHSLSPLIHNAWIQALGIDAVYSPYAVEPEGDDFERFVHDRFRTGCSGLNVTAPFKERALALAEEHEGELYLLDNANVLALMRIEDWDLLCAYNTDQTGLLSALRSTAATQVLAGRRALVLGAGSAARTAAVTLKQASAEVIVANRTFERALRLAQAVGVSAVPWAELENEVPRADILINATSAVHAGQALEVDLSRADIDTTVVELSYRPLTTPLLRQADSLGLRTVDGLAMLIGQARPSFEIFFGVTPPSSDVVDVRALCLAALEAG